MLVRYYSYSIVYIEFYFINQYVCLIFSERNIKKKKKT
jgi:hypothetical protein